MDAYLQETVFCNFSDPEIKAIGERVKSEYATDRERAVALYYFVRDEIHYRLGFWNKPASQTLREKAGTCTNASNLLVALLRSVGIPAGYGIAKVKGQEYLGCIVLPVLQRFIKVQSTHVYTCVYIDGRWLKCDPSNDIMLALNTQHFNAQSQLVDWQGNDHAQETLRVEHIISDESPVAVIDHIMDRNMKFYKIIPTNIANLYITFLREHGKNFLSVQEAETAFANWLKTRHLWYALWYALLGLRVRKA